MGATTKVGHTPGPWQIDGSFIRAVPGDDEYRGEIVASVVESPADGGGSIADSNARLIAAAPALAEALREAECVIRWAVQEAEGRVKAEMVGGWRHHADKARAALAAAGL